MVNDIEEPCDFNQVSFVLSSSCQFCIKSTNLLIMGKLMENGFQPGSQQTSTRGYFFS